MLILLSEIDKQKKVNSVVRERKRKVNSVVKCNSVERDRHRNVNSVVQGFR